MKRSTPATRAEQIWIERAGGEVIAGAWFAPRGRTLRPTAVLIVPGPAHEERAMAGGLMACAEALAGCGFGALVVDLHGCGQSSGRLDDADLAAHWRADLRAAVAATRARGHAATIMVGARLGALLVAEALGDVQALGFVGWMPVVSGRRYLRELRLLGATAVGAALSIGGFDWPVPLIGHLEALELRPVNAGAALLLDADDRAARAFGAACSAPLERRRSTDSSAWLFGNRDEPPLPQADIAALVAWCVALDDRRSCPDRPPAAASSLVSSALCALETPGTASTAFAHGGRWIREEAVEFGAGRLHGVLCLPAEAPASGAVRLLASTVGPGRTFVDFARDQAAQGHGSLRFDFAGFGISPPARGESGGRVYAPNGRDDVDAAVEHLRAAGHMRIALVGYCAGAWSMLQAGARGRWTTHAAAWVDSVVAINVQLQHVPAATAGARARRNALTRVAARFAQRRGLRRLGRWLERATDQEPLRWVVTLADAGVPMLLAYADRDPGLAHLQRHLDAVARPALRVAIIDELGHLADNAAARALLLEQVTVYLAQRDASARPGNVAPPDEPSALWQAGPATIW